MIKKNHYLDDLERLTLFCKLNSSEILKNTYSHKSTVGSINSPARNCNTDDFMLMYAFS